MGGGGEYSAESKILMTRAAVMPGARSSLRRLRKLVCVPGIHAFLCKTKDVDGRDKPGHDDSGLMSPDEVLG
jgi:hypothetical protein